MLHKDRIAEEEEDTEAKDAWFNERYAASDAPAMERVEMILRGPLEIGEEEILFVDFLAAAIQRKTRKKCQDHIDPRDYDSSIRYGYYFFFVLDGLTVPPILGGYQKYKHLFEQQKTKKI